MRGEASHGGFGAIVFKGSGVNDQFVGFFGGRGAWLIDHVFAIGAGAYVMGGGVDVQRTSGSQSLDMWYGGAEFELFVGDVAKDLVVVDRCMHARQEVRDVG